MRNLALFVVALASLVGCAQEPTSRYYSTYEITDRPGERLGPAEAARAHVQTSNSKLELLTSGKFDDPVRLIHAPQPTMPPRATEKGIEGRVTVRIYFDEAGKVEKVFVEQSPSKLLTDAVLEAVMSWEIAPPSSKGVRVKIGLRQTFAFRVGS